MSTPLLAKLLSDLLDDLQTPDILWQVGTVLVCFVLALLLSRQVRKNFFIGRVFF
ncbi:hypothetical protein EJG51_018715 [Undibacterium piscinae]|uniref:Uncharacterized protein n=1 Tax=Undibacterium piscinae TaxID=2495591 RepID=A0A6M4A8K2_9BURK|nr:hypothetical protein EJG51_018715 [Undibacterium piscinae]